MFEAVGWRAAENYAQLAAVLELHDQGLHAYTARDWAKAEAAFAKLLEVDPSDGPAKIYRDRVRMYAKIPPPEDWDGVWVMADK